jgi:hypothetical protein
MSSCMQDKMSGQCMVKGRGMDMNHGENIIRYY